MNPKDFIKNRLRKIYETVKSINIKYEYRENEDTHLIEVTPLSEFNDNSKYIEMERDLLFDFNDLYFPSTILFVSDNSLNKVISPEFALRMYREEYPIEVKLSVKKPNWNFTCNPIPLSSGENNYALAA